MNSVIREDDKVKKGKKKEKSQINKKDLKDKKGDKKIKLGKG